MKKVLFLVSSLSTGGAERVVSNLSLNLSKEISNKIILFENKIVYPYRGEIELISTPKYNSFARKLLNFISIYRQVKKIKKKHGDIPSVSFLEYPNLINIFTKKYGRTIVSVRNHMSTKHKKGLNSLIWNLTIRYFYKKSEKVIAVSEQVKIDLIKKYNIPAEKTKVIYNSYNIDEIQILSREEIEDEYVEIFNKPVVITAGRLSNQKGQWHLIRAFKSVKEKASDAQLVILGEGELENQLVQLSKDLNLYNDIHFLGFRSNPFKYIAKSKVFVLSSLYEGFPNALAEAMACGIPVISSDCLSGPREILAPKEFKKTILDYKISKSRYGILVPVCDGIKRSASANLTREEAILADKLTMILEDKDLHEYFSQKSSERIKDFDIQTIIKDWEKLILYDD